MHDDYDQEQGRRRGGRIATFLIALVAVAVFAGGIWFAYDRGMQRGASGGAPPLVRADGSPTKVSPANPGGLQVPNQDMKIYDTLPRGGQPAREGAEKLLPPPEQPAPAGAPPPPASLPPSQASVPQPAAPVAAAPAPPAPAVTQPAPTPPAPPVTAAVAPPGPGVVRVQLAAHRDRTAAEAEWARLQKKFPDILAGLAPTFERADLGNRGVFIRVQAGPLRDRPAAQAICDRLKAAKQGCAVVGK